MRKREMNDHEFAKHLRKHGALDNWTHEGQWTYWRNGIGEIVAKQYYPGMLQIVRYTI